MKEYIEIERKVKYKLPSVPNYLCTEEGQSIPISNFSTQELERIAEEWKKQLLKKAKS